MASCCFAAALPSTALASHKKVVGAVYTETNGPTGNKVVAFNRYADGTLKQHQTVATGGKGGLQPQPGCTPPPGCPILDTQGEVGTSADGSVVFAVNAGSNSVSSFRVSSSGKLVHVSTISSGGKFPNSLTSSGNLLYVLNSDTANIAGFHFNSHGHLSAIHGSSKPLAGTFVTGLARQIGFDNTGKILTVTLLGNPMLPTPDATKTIDTFVVHANGKPGSAIVHDATSPFPFAFAYTPKNQLVVAQVTSLTTPGAGQVGSYSVSSSGGLTSIDTKPSSGTAPCWVSITHNGKYAFVVNTGGGAPGGSTVTRYKLASNGDLTALGVDSETSSEFAKTDEVLSGDSKYLYVLNPSIMAGNTSRIDEYKVGADGSLSLIGDTPSTLAAGASGLAGS
jgi:hypothetical protein